MSEIQEKHPTEAHTSQRGFWAAIEFVAFRFADWIVDNLVVMRKEADLFLGALFTVLGVANWSVGKYCDGNTADYLSCTRPTVYYFYGGIEIGLIALGVVFILVWFVKNRAKK